MPIFNFVCESCGEKFEELVKSFDTPAKCKCGKKTTKKEMSDPALPIFKTTGFYITDYAKKNSTFSRKKD